MTTEIAEKRVRPHTVRGGASLLEIREPTRQRAGKKKPVPGRKLQLVGFSPKARYRLARELSQIEWPVPPAHVTLTYHREWPEDPKADLAAFRKWCQRRGFCGIWRLEFQAREAGPVPHYHVLLTGFSPSDEPALRAWWGKTSKNWSKFAVNVSYREAGRAAWYLALHTAKNTQAPKIRVGRWWGWIDRERVIGFQRRIDYGVLNDAQYNRLCRIARRLTRGRLRIRREQSLSLFLSQWTQERLLRYLADYYGEGGWAVDPF